MTCSLLGNGFSSLPHELMMQPSQQAFKGMPGRPMQDQGQPLASIGNEMQLMGGGVRGMAGQGQMGQGSLRNTLGLPAGTRGSGQLMGSEWKQHALCVGGF